MIAVSNPTVSGESLAKLIDVLSARAQAGELPDLAALQAEYPQHATELERLLPAVAVLADLSRNGMFPIEGTVSATEPLGDFQLIREVGRGGMGVVYEATQMSLNRRVALKVLPFAATMDPRHLQRFKNEALAAASLEHPHIVPVYGVGSERGVHYYAMKLIDGQTLAQIIAETHGKQVDNQGTADFKPTGAESPTAPVGALSTEFSGKGKELYRTAARVIADAADALEHAHSFGIVHRDIKPGNLMIDGAGKVFVTDFGLARFGPDAGLTMSGDLLGTLRYMSPEQAMARHGLVDHRTDIYSLGATLYELLTGQPAVVGEDKQEVLKHIAFDEPVTLRKIDRGIPVELETITLKALAKNPTERYGSAKELAEDLRRWMEDRPIRAKPPTIGQRAARWSRRHRTLTASASVGVLSLLIVLSLALVFVNKARQQARDDEKRVDEQRQIAVRRSEQLEKLNNVIGLIFQDLNPELNPDLGDNTHAAIISSLRLRLEATAHEFNKESIGDPLKFAKLQHEIGSALITLGQNETGTSTLEKAYATVLSLDGLDTRTKVIFGNTLAFAYRQAGRLNESLSLNNALLAQCEAFLGPNVFTTIMCRRQLADTYMAMGRLTEAISLYEVASKASEVALEYDDPHAITVRCNLANAYRRTGRVAESLPILEAGLQASEAKFGTDHPITNKVSSQLVAAYTDAGQLDKALPLAESRLRAYQAKFGLDHPQTLFSQEALGLIYINSRRAENAVPLFEQLLRSTEAVQGPDSRMTIERRLRLGYAYLMSKRPNQAIEVLETAIGAAEAKFGIDHDVTIKGRINLALAYVSVGRGHDAIQLLEAPMQRMESQPWIKKMATADALASAYKAVGRLPEAIALYKETIKGYEEQGGSDQVKLLFCRKNLADTLAKAGRWEDAVPLFQQCVDYVERRGFVHAWSVFFIDGLANGLSKTGRNEEAEALRRKWVDRLRKRSPPDPVTLAMALFHLATHLLDRDRPDEADPLLRESLEIREKQTPDSWATYAVRTALGRALLDQKKYDEAEPLLMGGFQGMKAREALILSNERVFLEKALDLLIRLFDETQRPNEAAKWRAERAKFSDTPSKNDGRQQGEFGNGRNHQPVSNANSGP